jgi:hypothetical protein
MGEIIPVERQIYGKSTFTNTVDVQFTELIPSTQTEVVAPTIDVDKFFDEYDTLFFDIPPSGSNSHETIVARSTEYIGISIEELEEEIRQLREENVSLRQQLFSLSNS